MVPKLVMAHMSEPGAHAIRGLQTTCTEQQEESSRDSGVVAGETASVTATKKV